MDWTTTFPKMKPVIKRAYFWAITDFDHVTIILRSGKTGVHAFAGSKVKVKLWGDAIPFPLDWTTSPPIEEGWYAVSYDDKTKGFVRVAIGEKLHCYDFDIPSEIEMRKIVSWFGPYKLPDPPIPELPVKNQT
jgi:hypothetical protein